MNTSTKLKVVTPGDKNTPGRLADELRRASERKRSKIEKAEDEYVAVRGNVISRGVERIKAIRELRAELDAEESGLTAVVGEVE